jgi:deazaflavin-dependent oxidoreductase (nitroreductase family)
VTVTEWLATHADDDVCHIQTIGRVSGRRRTVEIWFAVGGERVYLLSGGRDRAHWVRNLRADPRVRVRIGGRTIEGHAREIEGTDGERAARELLAAKYQGWRPGRRLSSWASGSLPVEISFDADQGSDAPPRGALRRRLRAVR